MKLVKSLLLGSAAGIVAAVSAQAADLPTKKAAPAEYVKVCNAYGVGFFYIPGTETCLRIGGFVRAEYAWMNARNTLTPSAIGTGTFVNKKAIDETGFRARGRLQFDVRNQTAWGTLRAFGRFDFTSDQGIYRNGNGLPTSTNTNNYVSVRYIFVQWAGITAGQAQSFFDFYADAINWERLRGSDTYMPLLAYTATFGGGFSATLSVEDRGRRIANNTGAIANNIGGTVANVTYAGYRMPDVVANLRVDQAWGSAQLSGAMHHVNTIQGTTAVAQSADKWGYAVQAGVMFNLPQLAAGDQLWLQASYAKGALDYIGVGNTNQGNVSGGYLGRFHGGLQVNLTDAFASQCGGGVGYCLDLASGYSVTAGLRHFWAPNFRQDIYGSYLYVKPGTAQRTANWGQGGLLKTQEYTVGTTFTWIPVSGFEIGMDLVYSKLKNELPAGSELTLPGDVKVSPDTYQARLRFQRSF